MAIIKLYYTPPTLAAAQVQVPEFEPVHAKSVEEISHELAAAGRTCWFTLFTSVLTEADLEKWEKTIPRYGCDCERFYQSWKRDNAPTFPLSFRWKHELKTAVNAKLGKPNISFEEAFELYLGPA